MARFQKLVAVSLAAGLVFSACSKKDDNNTSTGGNNEATSGTQASDATSTSTSTSSTTSTTVDTSKDTELAKQALIGTSDLPAGSWTKGSDSSSDSNSGNLLDIDSCKALAGDVKAAAAEPTGKASESFTQGAQDEFNLGNDVEIYASKDTLKEIKSMTNSADFGTCFTDFVKKEMSTGSTGGLTVTDIKTSAFNIGLSPDDVGVDFVTGIEVSFSAQTAGQDVSFVLRGVFIGVDRGMTIVNVMGISVPALGMSADVSTIDLKPTVKAAGKNLVSVMRTS